MQKCPDILYGRFIVSFRTENVALHKACNMSSRWNSHRSVDAAVNNKTSGKYDATNCILTNQTDYNPWWEVDLSRPYPVYNITVWATTVCKRERERERERERSVS